VHVRFSILKPVSCFGIHVYLAAVTTGMAKLCSHLSQGIPVGPVLSTGLQSKGRDDNLVLSPITEGVYCVQQRNCFRFHIALPIRGSLMESRQYSPAPHRSKFKHNFRCEHLWRARRCPRDFVPSRCLLTKEERGNAGPVRSTRNSLGCFEVNIMAGRFFVYYWMEWRSLSTLVFLTRLNQRNRRCSKSTVTASGCRNWRQPTRIWSVQVACVVLRSRTYSGFQ
jgi:hypothetical protein